MARDIHAQMHHHRRMKPVSGNHDALKRFYDRAMYAVAFVGPWLLFIQVLKIWVQKETAGISAWSFGLLTLYSIFFLVYGILHKEPPIIITNVMFVLFDILIVVGVLVL